MSTTGPVMTVTDELLAELDNSVRVVWHDEDSVVIAVDALTAELRRLRAENVELAKDAGLYRWLRDESLSCGKTAPAIMVVDEAGNPVYRGNPWNSLLCDDDADIAIDTAMADQ